MTIDAHVSITRATRPALWISQDDDATIAIDSCFIGLVPTGDPGQDSLAGQLAALITTFNVIVYQCSAKLAELTEPQETP